MGARPRDPDDGSDHARGEGHAGQDPGDVRQGDAPAAGRPDDPVRRRRLRLSGARRRGARTRSQGSTVKVASVATGFPSGQTFRDIKVAETRAAVEAGADEVDMVIDRGAFLAGRLPDRVRGDRRGQGGLPATRTSRSSSRPASSRRTTTSGARSCCAMAAGADFIKTSTGKVTPGGDAAGHAGDARGDPRLRAVDRSPGRDEAGRRDPRPPRRRSSTSSILYETLGPRWMSPDWFRFGASSPAQRRPDADRVPAHRPLPGPGRLHARLDRAGPAQRHSPIGHAQKGRLNAPRSPGNEAWRVGPPDTTLRRSDRRRQRPVMQPRCRLGDASRTG